MEKIIIYTSYLYPIGGIETWVYNFVDLMHEKYELVLMTKNIPPRMKAKLSEKISVVGEQPMECDTLLMVRIMDEVPRGVTYKKMIRTCHACKSRPEWHIIQDYDYLVNVSKASKKSFGYEAEKGTVIHNMLQKSDKKSLLIVSATRIPAPDKGKNAERILKLAKMLNDAEIDFLWFNFSDNALINPPKGLFNVGTSENIQNYIEKADYLVQLSDTEGFCYSVIEALINHTAVICTPFSTTSELGVKDGINGYIVPFDMNFDVKKLLNVPKFEFDWDNKPLIEKWDKILTKKPKKKKVCDGDTTIKIVRDCYDSVNKRDLKAGEQITVPKLRADKIVNLGFGVRL